MTYDSTKATIDEQGRPEPPLGADELGTLVGFLDFQRATLEWKARGLPAEGLRATVGVSTMTLGGLLKHMAYVEDHWFRKWLRGLDQHESWESVDWEADIDWDWNSAAQDTTTASDIAASSTSSPPQRRPSVGRSSGIGSGGRGSSRDGK